MKRLIGFIALVAVMVLLALSWDDLDFSFESESVSVERESGFGRRIVVADEYIYVTDVRIDPAQVVGKSISFLFYDLLELERSMVEDKVLGDLNHVNIILALQDTEGRLVRYRVVNGVVQSFASGKVTEAESEDCPAPADGEAGHDQPLCQPPPTRRHP